MGEDLEKDKFTEFQEIISQKDKKNPTLNVNFQYLETKTEDRQEMGTWRFASSECPPGSLLISIFLLFFRFFDDDECPENDISIVPFVPN